MYISLSFHRVTKEVDANSKEAKKELKKQESEKDAGATSGLSLPG